MNRVPEAIAAYERVLARLARPAEFLVQPGAVAAAGREIAVGPVVLPQSARAGHLRRRRSALELRRHLHGSAPGVGGGAELRTALRLNPGYVPALLNLANLCEDLGRREEACDLYRRSSRSSRSTTRRWHGWRMRGLLNRTTPGIGWRTRRPAAVEHAGLGLPAACARGPGSVAGAEGRVSASRSAACWMTGAITRRRSPLIVRPISTAGPVRDLNSAAMTELSRSCSWRSCCAPFSRVARPGNASSPTPTRPHAPAAHFHLRHVSLRLDARRTAAVGPSGGAGGRRAGPDPGAGQRTAAAVSGFDGLGFRGRAVAHGRRLCRGVAPTVPGSGLRHGQAAGQLPLPGAHQETVPAAKIVHTTREPLDNACRSTSCTWITA